MLFYNDRKAKLRKVTDMMYCILYNPKAGDGKGKEKAEQLRLQYDSAITMDLTQIRSWNILLERLAPEDRLVLCGGDGTLNRFVNATAELEIQQQIFYAAAGSGNDFFRDVSYGMKEPINITKYLKNLPTVEVNNRKLRFLNGVGYGIDGYCCEVGDRQRLAGKKINYAQIAIGGLLGGYQPREAEVVVDGQCFHYRKVWLAPTMKGKYYGGGMMPAPEQNRLNCDGKVSLTVIHGSGKLRTLAVFPSLFQGTHITHKDMITVHRGKEIIVWFDKPTSLQVDGETILHVNSYHVHT